MARVASVHYAIVNPFIYTIIFNFFFPVQVECFVGNLM